MGYYLGFQQIKVNLAEMVGQWHKSMNFKILISDFESNVKLPINRYVKEHDPVKQAIERLKKTRIEFLLNTSIIFRDIFKKS